jgi:hypothetical protein
LKITVLLGAGASTGAGVPTSAGMTDGLLDRISDRSKPLLHFVYGGLLMQAAAKAYSGHSRRSIVVEAEDLFNAVEALANRASFDAAPFVASWHPLIDQFDRYRAEDLEQEINRGLRNFDPTSEHGARGWAKTIARAISLGTTSKRFQQVAADMIAALKEILAIGDPSRLEYLSSLLELHRTQDGGLLIASLNYDTLIEQIGSIYSVRADDCLDEWLKSGTIKRSDAITLLKLHGSITWVQDRDSSIHRDIGQAHLQPALIFGGINKLRADGPYLEMLMEWRSHLDQCDHLLIIGYSFRDTHVNATIERWHRQNEEKRITILDPGFDKDVNSLTWHLHQLSNETLGPFVTSGNLTRQSSERLEAPVQLIKAKAEEALQDLFTQISKWPPTSTDRPMLKDAIRVSEFSQDP